jgi:asparagine synthetase B (glutamine-hydrolysing)
VTQVNLELTAQVSENATNFFVATLATWPQLHSFSIGLENSPDLLAARKAAHYLGTVHHEYVFTVQEGLDAIPDVIYHLETYDVTTVRASTPMYLLSRKIKAMGVKMVLSGEGSDEIFGGNTFFFRIANSEGSCFPKDIYTSMPLLTRKHSNKNVSNALKTSIPLIASELTSKLLVGRKY